MEQMHQSAQKLDNFFLNKVIVISGASSGIGRSLTFWYLNQGAKVVLIGRSIDTMDEIARQYPSQAMVVQADLSDDIQAFEMRQAVIERF
jgi:meso-butanediol dehydrogenase/(S,S)-butanediol dehydrogenase/diacetyl reductase